ncbi:hypothetical protein PAXINDRAFT_165181 [Paxillus involutus ATCC 200175]|nr:hypothetical protein PAXINDRAFT_165181 [Paxillus involutus ATCC 200175]
MKRTFVLTVICTAAQQPSSALFIALSSCAIIEHRNVQPESSFPRLDQSIHAVNISDIQDDIT